jgi:hypothetical protein
MLVKAGHQRLAVAKSGDLRRPGERRRGGREGVGAGSGAI